MGGKNKPRIGFVILAWNSEKVIDRCLGSIAGLERISPRAVIADNGSTDGTAAIIRRHCLAAPGTFELVRHAGNMGTTVPRNEGLKRLSPEKPDYYCILDSDTEVNDEAFMTLIGQMELHPEYGIIGPAMASSDGTAQTSARSFPTVMEKVCKAVPIKALQKKGEAMERQGPPRHGAESWPVDYLMSACWLMRPEAVERAGLLDERIFYAPEDAEYCIRMWKSGYEAAFCPKARIIHEWQRISKKKLVSRMNWEHVKGLAYMFKKHRYLFSAGRLRKSFKTFRTEQEERQ